MLDRKMTPSDSFQEEIFNETIIEEIGKYPCLYNSEDAKFGVSFGSIWQDIAAVVDSTVTHCKLRWQELLQKYEQERLNSVELISDWVHFQSIDQMLQHGIVKVCRNFDESDSIAQKKQICRTCLKVADLCNTYYIFETENLYTKYVQCTNLEVDSADGYPLAVCAQCYYKILDIHQFQVMCRESLEEYNVIECTEATNTLETNAEELVLNTESQNNASITNFEVNIISPEDKKQAFDEETSQVVDPLASHTELELYLSNVIVKNKPGCTLDTAKKEQRITNEMLKCETCSKMLPTQHSLDAHKRRHLGLLGYPCKYENCGRGFNSYLEWIHNDNEHKGIANSFKCDIDNCNEVFKLYGALNHHKRKDHNLVRSSANGKQVELRYACDEEGCTRRFDILSKLQIHKKRHAGIKDFVCPYCGMRKTTKTELNIHINIHTFEKKYSCPICSKIFRCVGSVSTHIHHVHERRRITKGSKPPASASRYPCSICGRLLANLISLKNHEDTHAAEKAYACGECGKKFSTRMGRYNHMKTHIKGEKPHKCKACAKRFSMKKKLLIHQALHKGTHSLYVCEICGQCFKWPGAFYSHKKKHLNVGTTEVSTDNQMDLDGVVNDEEPLKGICEISADNEVEVDVVQV